MKPLLLERDEVLDDLVLAVAAARRDEGRLLLLAGPAGVGKTSVVRALVERVEGTVRVLHGTCDALATPRPLGPLLDMAGHEPRLALATQGARQELFSTVLEELTTTPTLMVFEDVHWVDEATADLLLYLGRRVERTRSLVVATYRDEDVRNADPLAAVLGGLATTSGIARARLDPLSQAAVARLVGDRSIEPSHLHRVTGGNPFFVTEVLAAPGWVVPPTVADAVRARARRLPDRSRGVLDAVAVESGPVRLDQLLALGQRPADVDEVVASGMLVHDRGRIAFRHELARLAIADDLAPTVCRRLHQEWLALLETEGVGDEDAARLAAHAKGAGVEESVLAWTSRAARVAAGAGAHREAVRHYEDAVSAARRRPVAERADLAQALARELTLVDRRHEAVAVSREVVDLRRQAGDTPGAVVASAELAKALWSSGDGPGARRLMDAAVAEAERLEPGWERAMVHAWAGYLAMLQRDTARAKRLTSAALQIARPQRLDDVSVYALNALGSTMIVGDGDVGGVAPLEESRTIAAAHGWDGRVEDALGNLGSALGEVRQYALAQRYLQEAIAYATERDLDGGRHYGSAWLARIWFEQGRWDEARSLAVRLGTEKTISPISVIVSLTVLGRIAARTGLPHSGFLEEAWRLARQTDDLQRLWPVVAGRAEAVWLAGERAGGVTRDVGAVLQSAVELDVTWAREELAFWLHRLGGGRDAGGGDESTPYGMQLAGRHAEAAEVWRALGCPYEGAWALAERGDEHSLRQALDVLMGLGAKPLATRVRHRLRGLGTSGIPVGPRAATAGHPAGLTPRQVEVLRMLAAGLTDRQIGERLFISPKTVGHHVSAILGVLGVDGRAGAVRTAWERGWVDLGEAEAAER